MIWSPVCVCGCIFVDESNDWMQFRPTHLYFIFAQIHVTKQMGTISPKHNSLSLWVAKCQKSYSVKSTKRNVNLEKTQAVFWHKSYVVLTRKVPLIRSAKSMKYVDITNTDNTSGLITQNKQITYHHSAVIHIAVKKRG